MQSNTTTRLYILLTAQRERERESENRTDIIWKKGVWEENWNYGVRVLSRDDLPSLRSKCICVFVKMEKIEYRAVIKYLFLKGNTPTQITTCFLICVGVLPLKNKYLLMTARYSIFSIFTKTLTSTYSNDCQTTIARQKWLKIW